MEQIIISGNDAYKELDDFFEEKGTGKILLVCESFISTFRIGEYMSALPQRLGIEVVRFSDFCPNPEYESVEKGVELYKNQNCDTIFAVGGGSAIDVAKCIKLYSNMDSKVNYLKQEIIPNEIPLIAMPTTAGTGSEATRFAVIYYEGQKQSVNHISCIPQVVLLDPDSLKSLPDYHRKSTMLDALCHSVESFWSVNSTEESREYSRKAIRQILENMDAYLANTVEGNRGMLLAANTAGKAINITQTTAGHALCYKLTSLYGIAHGHAAALCVEKLWPYMVENADKCIDSRGKGYLESVFLQIAKAMGCEEVQEAVAKFSALLQRLNLRKIQTKDNAELEVLCGSVNPDRMKNHPVKLEADVIETIYRQILGIGRE